MAGRAFHLGYVGLRLTASAPEQSERRVASVGDLEVGGALGAGGELCGNDDEWECGEETEWDGRSWNERVAGGAYVGVGGAIHIEWFALYLRLRAQLTGATEIPETFWGTAYLGLQATIGGRLRLHVATGIAGFANELDAELGWGAEVGLRLLLGDAGRPPAEAARQRE